MKLILKDENYERIKVIYDVDYITFSSGLKQLIVHSEKSFEDYYEVGYDFYAFTLRED